MKKNLLGLMAVVLSLTTAFTTYRPFSMWSFTGNSTVPSQRVDPTRYSSASPSGCTGTEQTLCAIDAPPNGSTGRPNIDPTGTLYNQLYNGGASTPVFASTSIHGKPL